MKPVSIQCVSPLGVDPDRVGVAADPRRRLIDDDLVLAVQLVGGDEPGDPVPTIAILIPPST